MKILFFTLDKSSWPCSSGLYNFKRWAEWEVMKLTTFLSPNIRILDGTCRTCTAQGTKIDYRTVIVPIIQSSIPSWNESYPFYQINHINHVLSSFSKSVQLDDWDSHLLYVKMKQAEIGPTMRTTLYWKVSPNLYQTFRAVAFPLSKIILSK